VKINSCWGNVEVNAFTGISINAPNGNISIKGKNVSIEAGNNLTLKYITSTSKSGLTYNMKFCKRVCSVVSPIAVLKALVP